MTAIGLDMSLSATGIAVIDSDDVTLRTVTARGKNNLLRRRSVIDMVTIDLPAHIDMVCIEQPAMNPRKAVGAFLQITLTQCMTDELVACGIPVLSISQSTLKKWATGNGRAQKPQMIAAAHAAGINVKDDNQADAYWLADMARAIVLHRAGNADGLNPYRLEVVRRYGKAGAA